jgi:hypothetical protein
VRVVPERSAGLQLVAAFGGFLAGPFVALRMSMTLAPESELVQSVSVLAFAAIFAVGALVWLGFGFAAVALSFFWHLLRGRRTPAASLAPSQRIVPPGYRAFVVTGGLLGLLVGVLAGLATDASVGVALAAWTALGLAYGLLLWAAAHHGYLPFDPE